MAQNDEKVGPDLSSFWNSLTENVACRRFSDLVYLTQIRLGFLKVVFSEGGGQFDTPFTYQEELTYYQYNFIQLLNNLFKVC